MTPQGRNASVAATTTILGTCAAAASSEIDASIARRADTEFLYDKPYEDNKRSPRRRARSPSRASRRTACSASTRTMT
ncbi:MAG: hypothetical protein MZV70_17610 [Desulfobacterales bacterium]|nr:hypothetical protein [Desulfobacterales bacterium]